MNFDYNRLLKVALGGAVTAVMADIIYTQFGDELGPLLDGILENIGATGNTPKAPDVYDGDYRV